MTTRFLDILQEKHCITKRHRDRIDEHRTKTEKNKVLLSIIRRRSSADFQSFKRALQDTNQHGVSKLFDPDAGIYPERIILIELMVIKFQFRIYDIRMA